MLLTLQQFIYSIPWYCWLIAYFVIGGISTSIGNHIENEAKQQGRKSDAGFVGLLLGVSSPVLLPLFLAAACIALPMLGISELIERGFLTKKPQKKKDISNLNVFFRERRKPTPLPPKANNCCCNKEKTNVSN